MTSLNKNYKKVKEEGCVNIYDVNFDEKNINEMENNAILKVQTVISLPGFRQGKVPLQMIKEQFPSMIKDELIEISVRSTLNEIVKEENIYPIASPKISDINYEKNKKLSFKIQLETNPKIEPKNYEKIKVLKKEKNITEEDINNYLKGVKDYNSYLKSVEDNIVVNNNHYVIVDYEIFENGEKIKDGDIKGEIIEMSSVQNIAGMNDALMGAKKGDIKEFETEFDSKKMKFVVKILEIKEKIVPELDENFFKNIGVKDLEELKNNIKQILENEEKQKSEKEVIKQIEDSLIKDNEIPLPPTIVEEEIKELFEVFKKRSNIENPDSLKISDYLEHLKPIAERNLKITYLLHNIAKKENIKAIEEDLQKELDKVIISLKSEEEIKKAKEMFNQRRDYIMASIVENKTFEFIKSKANIEETK